MDYVIDPPAQPSLGVAGSDARFPVNRIWCIGRNYLAHAKEMGHDGNDQPIFFAKPGGAATNAAEVPYPPMTSDLHHEAELVVALGAGGRDIAEADVMSRVWGAAAGVDLTRRDLQADAKERRRPWEMAKAFDHSAPMSPIVPIEGCGPLDKGRIALTVNGETRQEADLSQMIWSVAQHVADLSRYVELRPGDLVMTGTPSGVAAIERGDRVEVTIEGVGSHAFTMV